MRIILIILSILLFLVGCSSEDPQPSPSPTGGTATPGGVSASPAEDSNVGEDTVRLKKTTIKTRQGQKWELEAEKVDWEDDRSRALATDVDWWLIDEDGKKWVKVESPGADIDMDEEVVVFTGETVATRLGFPESLRVQKLVYKGKERKFYGFGGVLWTRDTVELWGETLTATAELDKVLLQGGVKGKTQGGLKGLKEPRKAD